MSEVAAVAEAIKRAAQDAKDAFGAVPSSPNSAIYEGTANLTGLNQSIPSRLQ